MREIRTSGSEGGVGRKPHPDPYRYRLRLDLSRLSSVSPRPRVSALLAFSLPGSGEGGSTRGSPSPGGHRAGTNPRGATRHRSTVDKNEGYRPLLELIHPVA